MNTIEVVIEKLNNIGFDSLSAGDVYGGSFRQNHKDDVDGIETYKGDDYIIIPCGSNETREWLLEQLKEFNPRVFQGNVRIIAKD